MLVMCDSCMFAKLWQ